MTETGIVGTYGGLDIPPVTAFMDGFYLGVQKYNEVKGTDVQVLGWDPVARTACLQATSTAPMTVAAWARAC